MDRPDDATDTAGDAPDEQPGRPNPDATPPGDGPDVVGDDGPDRGSDGQRPGQDHAPAAVAKAPGRVRPPRRTGIFVDPEDLRSHVGGLLRAMLGSYQVDAFGNFTFTHDGARVFVTIGASPMGTHVGVYSVTNIDLDLTPDLAAFLATTNHRLGFGTLSYDRDNRAVWLRHTLLGTALDAPELQSAVASVAQTAAAIDDQISERFGGRAFEDAPQDMRDSTAPPTSESTDEPGDDPPTNVTGYL